MNVWVEALVRFAVVLPDDDAEADTRADDIGDAIERAVNGLSILGVYDESASIIDWTQREDV